MDLISHLTTFIKKKYNNRHILISWLILKRKHEILLMDLSNKLRLTLSYFPFDCWNLKRKRFNIWSTKKKMETAFREIRNEPQAYH
jgi:hypothetical protein